LFFSRILLNHRSKTDTAPPLHRWQVWHGSAAQGCTLNFDGGMM
jgi:hypothetical protein